MKLGIILLESLLEAGVATISDKFYTEFGKTTTTLGSVKDQVASIKNKAKEGYLKSASNIMADPYEIKDSIINSIPNEELNNLFVDIAKRFVDSVFLRLKYKMPENIQYSIKNLPQSKRIARYELGEDGKLKKVSAAVGVSGDGVEGYIPISIEFPKGGMSPIKVNKEKTKLEYTPKGKDTLYLVDPNPGKQYYTGVKRSSSDLDNDVTLTAPGAEMPKVQKRRKQDSEERERKNMGVRDLFYAFKKKANKSTEKEMMLRVQDFIEGQGQYEAINADRLIKSIFRPYEIPIKEKPGNMNKVKDRIGDLLTDLVNMAIKNDLIKEDDVYDDATIEEEGEEKDGKVYMFAKKGPVGVLALVDNTTYVVYLKSPDKDRLTDVVIYNKSLIN
jgi:hypothetical protein